MGHLIQVSDDIATHALNLSHPNIIIIPMPIATHTLTYTHCRIFCKGKIRHGILH